MQLNDKVIFITGANRGIGKALVEASLKHGAKKVYAAARKLESLPDFGDARVVPIGLDITDAAQVKAATAAAADTQLLINNAGALAFASLAVGDLADIQNDMNVNFFGTLNVTRAFAPVIEANGGGGIASIGSIVSLAPMPGIGGYSAAKAALHSAIQATRGELKSKNIAVFGIYPGPIDTDMARSFDMAKTSPQVTAENILTAIEHGEEDIFPDPMSSQLGQLWKADPKGLERQFAAM